MSTQKSINGINIQVSFCNQINCQPIPLDQISKGAPLANVYAKEGVANTYTVNIVSHVPTQLNIDTPPDPNVVVSLDNNAGYLYLAYNGIQAVNTPINQGNVNCRVFWFEYNSSVDLDNPPADTQFNLYHTQFDYTIEQAGGNAEAIFVQERNDDPETDRGTVTTPAKDD
ncbi:hypothetical protein [Tenacibaculum sp. 190524A05c]|uniref:Uncharacterized protein n=1 Tax=Tenacibaculum platacis TaxID=3137852 RepID=A0ABM9P0J3_9FLAO